MRNVILVILLVAGCGKASPPAPCADTGDPPAAADLVCAHLSALGCDFEVLAGVDGGGVCFAEYESWSRRVPAGEFARVTNCYLNASSCEVIDGCNATCGEGAGRVHADEDGGAPEDGGVPTDAGEPIDLGEPTDSGSITD